MLRFLNIEILYRIVLGNQIFKYIDAFFWFVILIILLKVFEGILLSRLKKLAEKTKTDLDDAFISIIGSIRPHFYLVLSIWIAIRTLYLAPIISKVTDAVAILIISYQIIHSVQVLLEYFAEKKTRDGSTKATIGAISFIGKLVLWSFSLLIILSSFGINISALVAGLGIGGIAVALAIQNILTDLFSSFSIYLDKPFEIGDFIKFNNVIGIVKKIGIKTTRIQSVEGEEVIVPNQSLVSSIVQNYGRLERRRAVVNIGVEYLTKNEILEKIPKIINEIIEDVDGASFDRCHLKNFGNSAIEFEVVYYVNSADYIKYMDIGQEILINIKKEFDKNNIKFAYPSQTIYLKK